MIIKYYQNDESESQTFTNVCSLRQPGVSVQTLKELLPYPLLSQMEKTVSNIVAFSIKMLETIIFNPLFRCFRGRNVVSKYVTEGKQTSFFAKHIRIGT